MLNNLFVERHPHVVIARWRLVVILATRNFSHDGTETIGKSSETRSSGLSELWRDGVGIPLVN